MAGQPLPDALAAHGRIDHEAELADMSRPTDTRGRWRHNRPRCRRRSGRAERSARAVVGPGPHRADSVTGSFTNVRSPSGTRWKKAQTSSTSGPRDGRDLDRVGHRQRPVAVLLRSSRACRGSRRGAPCRRRSARRGRPGTGGRRGAGSRSSTGRFDSIGTRWSAVPTTFITGQAIEPRSSSPARGDDRFSARRFSRISHSAVWRKHLPGNGMWSVAQPCIAWWAAM